MRADSLRPEDFRYERKFVVTAAPRQQVAAAIRLHSMGFFEAYPMRYVNSLYLDCPGRSAYATSVEGNSRRVKVRVRWYGECFGRSTAPFLELKIKRGATGAKRRFPLPSFELQPGFGDDTLRRLFARAELPADVESLVRSLHLKLLVRYRRFYYQATHLPIRLTTDDDLQFWALEAHDNQFLRSAHDRRTTVIELKYALPMDEKARQINQEWRFRVSKSSKYVTGLELVHLTPVGG